MKANRLEAEGAIAVGFRWVEVHKPFWTGFKLALGAMAAVFVTSVVWGTLLLVLAGILAGR